MTARDPERLGGLGFAVAQRPMGQGRPFANLLLVCDAGEAAS
jgi:hypothetical protein